MDADDGELGGSDALELADYADGAGGDGGASGRGALSDAARRLPPSAAASTGALLPQQLQPASAQRLRLRRPSQASPPQLTGADGGDVGTASPAAAPPPPSSQPRPAASSAAATTLPVPQLVFGTPLAGAAGGSGLPLPSSASRAARTRPALATPSPTPTTTAQQQPLSPAAAALARRVADLAGELTDATQRSHAAQVRYKTGRV
jgi:hypothetical protein